LIGRLSGYDLIAAGPREPRCNAPHTFVTIEVFFAAFGLYALRDLPDRERLADAALDAT
jgi:chromosome segregation and condensation protein ScpB